MAVIKFPSPEPKGSLNDLLSDLIAIESRARELEQLEPSNEKFAELRKHVGEALQMLRDLKADNTELAQEVGLARARKLIDEIADKQK